MSPRTVFMGSPALVVPILEAVARNSDLAAAITQPDRRAGRGRRPTPPAVKVAAEALGVPVLQPTRLRNGAVAAQLSDLGIDLAVVAAYGRILPPEVLAAPRRGCVNVHFSLLPRWRGAAPIQRAILAGDERTGVSIMQMDEGLDTGPLLDVAAVEIGPDETAGELGARLARLGAERIAALLRRFPDLPPARPQPQEGVTLAPKIDPSEGAIRWDEPADAIVRRVRATTPWPGASGTVGGVRLKLSEASVAPCREGGSEAPGAVLGLGPGGIVVRAGDGGCVAFGRVQPAGKRAMDARAFWAGYRRRVEGRVFDPGPSRA